MKTGRIFDIQRFSTHDGGGIRTNVFMKGCPLSCVWCQNPEGISADMSLVHVRSRCIKCFLCLKENEDVISFDGSIHVGRGSREEYQKLMEVCPTGALRMNCADLNEEELMDILEKDMPFYRHGGGVTFSGGEPLLQYGFVFEVASKLKEKGIHVAIESSQYADHSIVEREAEIFDTIFADLKEYDDERHRAFTSVGNERIKKNIELLLSGEHRDKVIIRTPLIPGFNATEEKIAGIAKYISRIYSGVTYELLNNNPLAASKYAALEREFLPGSDTEKFTRAQMERFGQVAEENGIGKILLGD